MSWQAKLLNRALKYTFKPLSYQALKNVNESSLARASAGFDVLTKFMPRRKYQSHSIKSPVNAQWLTPEKESGIVILYCHGGAYFSGSSQSHHNLTSALSQETGARVLALNYRQAPHFAFPAWIDDAMLAYQLILETTQAEKVIFAGDSAGGNLVLAALIKIRELDLPMPAGAICLSPWADLSCSLPSFKRNAESESLLNPQMLAAVGDFILQKETAKNPLLCPAFADYHGFPPLCIHVGSKEILLDDAKQIRRQAEKANVAIDYKEWEDLPHVFQIFVGFLPEATASIKELAAFMRRCTQ